MNDTTPRGVQYAPDSRRPVTGYSNALPCISVSTATSTSNGVDSVTVKLNLSKSPGIALPSKARCHRLEAVIQAGFIDRQDDRLVFGQASDHPPSHGLAGFNAVYPVAGGESLYPALDRRGISRKRQFLGDGVETSFFSQTHLKKRRVVSPLWERVRARARRAQAAALRAGDARAPRSANLPSQALYGRSLGRLRRRRARAPSA